MKLLRSRCLPTLFVGLSLVHAWAQNAPEVSPPPAQTSAPESRPNPAVQTSPNTPAEPARATPPSETPAAPAHDSQVPAYAGHPATTPSNLAMPLLTIDRPAPAFTQDELEPGFKISSDVQMVLLDVSVKNEDGGFVSGLKKEDFRIVEDRIPQTINAFTALDTPVTVGLVVDNSGSVRPKKHEIVTAAITFAKESNPKDEVFVVNFNDRVKFGLPEGTAFTDDRVMIREALLYNPAQGRTSLNDALKVSLEHLEKGRLDKKTLVVIADGGDNMSETTEEEILDMVRRSIATVYTIGIYNPGDKDKNPGFLKRLAHISGGRYYEPREIENLVGVCQQIAKDIRNRYTVGYAPANAAMDGKVRHIRVMANDPATGKQLVIRTRTQYVAGDSRSRVKR